MRQHLLYKDPQRIISSNTYKLPPDVSTRYFEADDWRFIYVQEGKAAYLFDGRREVVENGDLFLLGPNERKISTLGASPFKISVIFFDVENLSENKLLCLKNRGRSYRLLIEMFKEIHEHDKEEFHLELLSSMLKLFIRDYSENSEGDSRIRKALNIIKQQNGWRLSAEQLAQKVGLSRAHFNKLFKAQTGKAYALFCREFRMNLSLTLMQEYGLSSKQAANEIGSSSAQAFSREFKTYFGRSPSNFIK